ncbi:Meckel syndrome type 1 protein [Zerene cesonia]|uniref:Meckel syndrome type 1 protein n=1 Tax=Zerene cesonia TaxID=33412 RepID=UPI0018E598ED|nr:Meckel syndrome type 1 protein [Zerene cesonia]
MTDFIKSNASSGVYWLKEPLQSIKIRITIKTQESIISLPKFEDYSNISQMQNLTKADGSVTKEYVFAWQEKVFSQYEIKKYLDIHNCTSEWDLNLHNRLKQNNCLPQKIFTYLNEDCYIPLPVIEKKSYDTGLHYLNSCLECLNLNEKLSNVNLSETNSTRLLFSSQENVTVGTEWTAMHFMYDNSKYDDDDNIIYADECLLLSLYHHKQHNYLMVSHDVNNLSNPYNIESASGNLHLEYYVDIDFGLQGCSEELVDLLNKLYKKWQKKQKYFMPFVMPPLGGKKVFVSLEITSAKDFEMDNIYIEYHIKIPDTVQCKSDLIGRTHVSQSLVTEAGQIWLFGHTIDLELDIATGIDPPSLKIFFEVISQDWWRRHRTEGYSHLALTLHPGRYKEQLSCSRPEELNEIEAESRRFFVGGCHLIEDLEILEKPQLYAGNFRNVLTGYILVHWSTITQSQTPGHHSPVPMSSGTALLQGADAVLKQYKRAKATLAAATRNFRETGDL